MSKRRETNEEFVVRLMNFGPFGAMQQIFILTAIENYAKAVVAAPPMEHGLIDGMTWKKCGEWLLKQQEERS